MRAGAGHGGDGANDSVGDLQRDEVAGQQRGLGVGGAKVTRGPERAKNIDWRVGGGGGCVCGGGVGKV